MRRLKLVGPLLLAAALCFQTGCFRPYTLPESSGGETVQTLGTIGTSYTTDASDTQADTTGEDTTGSAVTDGSSSDCLTGAVRIVGNTAVDGRHHAGRFRQWEYGDHGCADQPAVPACPLRDEGCMGVLHRAEYDIQKQDGIGRQARD